MDSGSVQENAFTVVLTVALKDHFLSSQVTLMWPCPRDSHPLRILASQTGPCWVKPRVQLRNLICELMLSSLRSSHPSCNNINRLSVSQPRGSLYCSLSPNPGASNGQPQRHLGLVRNAHSQASVQTARVRHPGCGAQESGLQPGPQGTDALPPNLAAQYNHLESSEVPRYSGPAPAVPLAWSVVQPGTGTLEAPW